MFGGRDDNAQATDNAAAPQPVDNTLNGVSDLVGGDAPAATPQTYDAGNGFLPTPGDPAITAPQPTAAIDDAPAAEPVDDTPPTAPAAAEGHDDLLDIKQQALQQLSPLVGHLDQNPEEKFRTAMMMIQASDNHELIKEAYTAAQQITDEKTRAQALLDIVNEINYFTQGKNPTA